MIHIRDMKRTWKEEEGKADYTLYLTAEGEAYKRTHFLSPQRRVIRKKRAGERVIVTHLHGAKGIKEERYFSFLLEKRSEEYKKWVTIQYISLPFIYFSFIFAQGERDKKEDSGNTYM